MQVWQPLAPDLVIVTNTGDEGRRVEKLDPEDWMTSMTFLHGRLFCKSLCTLSMILYDLTINHNKLQCFTIFTLFMNGSCSAATLPCKNHAGSFGAVGSLGKLVCLRSLKGS